MIKSTTVRGWAASAVLVPIAVLTGCGDVSDLDANLPGVAEQAAVGNYTASLSDDDINEGSSTSLVISPLCVDNNTADTALVIVWGDGTAPQSIALPAADYVLNTASCPGTFEVCGPAHACSIPHTYADDSSAIVAGANNVAGKFRVRATATQGSSGEQTADITVRNLAPTISSFTRSGITNEGSLQTFTAVVNDPGLVATEVKSVVFSVAPGADADPATITCTCASSPNCDNGNDISLCGATGSGDSTFTFASRFLDNASFTATLTVTDKEDATVSLAAAAVAIANQVPELASVNITDAASVTLTASAAAGTPTTVNEGQPYTVATVLNDQGTDLLTFTGDLTTDGTNELSGTVAVSRVTRPNTEPSAALSTLGFRWNDNNDAIPATFPTTLTFTANDGDGGSFNAPRFVTVNDVSPTITSITPSATTVNEGQSVTTTVVAVDGDFGSEFDNIGANAITGSHSWTVTQSGLPARNVTTNGGLVNIYQVIGTTCTKTSATCEIKFLDNVDAGDTFVVGVTVFDEDSSVSAATTAITVNNVAPTHLAVISKLGTPGAVTSLKEGEFAAVNVTAIDPALALDGNYTLTVNFGDGTPAATTVLSALSLAPGSTFSTLSHLYADNDVCGPTGVCSVTTQVCEAGGPGAPCSVLATASLTIENVVPTVTVVAPSGASLVEGVAFNVDGEFNDPAAALDDDYAFNWAFNDGGTTRNLAGTTQFATRTTGVDGLAPLFTNVPAAGLSNVTFGLTVTDEDGGIGTGSSAAGSTVRDAVPTTTALSVAFPGGAAELATPAVTFTVTPENASDLLTSVVINWGDNTTTTLTGVPAPANATQFLNTGATLTISKPAPYADSDSNRATVATDAYTITVTAIDEEGVVNAALTTPARNPVATIQAAVTNVAPTIVSVVPSDNPVIVSEGQAAAFIITTSDVSLVDRTEAGFTLTVDWGDGTIPEPFPSSTTSGANQVFRAAHVYNNPRSANVTFTISDREGATDSESIVIEVVNIAPTITDLVNTGPVPEGVAVTVAALTDNRGADVLTYSFNFTTCVAPADAGDFGLPPGAANTSAVSSTTYFDEQSKLVCVRVCDDDNQLNSCSFAQTTVSVLNTAPVITSFSPPATITEGGSVNLTAVASELAGVTDVLTFAFDCTDDGTADVTNTTGLASCTYATSGTFTARVTVSDDDTGSATQTTTVRVTNLPPTAPTVAGNTVNEGSASTVIVTPGALGNGGAATRFEYDFDNNGIVDAVTANTTANFTYATDGTKTFQVRACDAEGACTAFVSGTNTVTNVRPVIATVNAPATVRLGSPVTVSVEATDVGNDALSYKFDFNTTPPQSVTTNAPFATVTINQVGTITATVTVTDVATTPAAPLTATQTKTFVVNNAGRITSFTTSAATVVEGGTVTLSGATAAQGAGLSDFSFDCANGTAPTVVNDAPTNAATATCRYLDNGSFLARLSTTDAEGSTDDRTVLIVVTNVAPVLAVTTPATLAASTTEGGLVSFAVTGTEAADVTDTVRFDYDFDGNGIFDLSTAATTASFRYTADGVFAAKVKACDEDGACSAAATVTVTVDNTAPVFAAVNGVSAPASVAVGSPLTVSAQATDAGNDALTYTFAFTIGGVTTTVGPQPNPFATITPTLSGAGSVVVTVADNGTPALTATQTASFVVDNEAPRLSSFTTTGNVTAIDESAAAQASIGFTAVATDRGGGALTFALDCASNGTVLTNTTGVFTCAYPKSGSFVATVTVTDVSNATDTRSFNLLVRNAAPSVPSLTPAATTTIDEGGTVALTATSTDAATDTLRYEFDLDNNGSFEFVSNTAVGAATFRPTQDGPAQLIAVRACDDENACSAAGSTSVNVTNVAPTINNFDVPSSSLVGSAVTVSVDASDVGGDTLSYAFEFSLGGAIQARVPATGFSATPVASVTLIDSGSYTVTAFVVDTSSVAANVLTTTETAGLTVNEISVNVTAQADPAVIDEGQTTNINVLPLGTGPYKVSYDTDADGDFDVLDVPCDDDAVPCELRDVRFPQNRSGDLSFRVLVKVIDEGQNDLLSTAIVAVTVNNVAPTITAVGDTTAVEGTLFTQTVTANDVGVEDTLTFAVVSAPAGLTIARGAVARTGLISWTPTFDNEGANNVTISVTDSDGASVEETFVITVTIVDTNNNGISDVEERALNDGELFCANTAACDALGDLDSDDDGVSDLDELLAGTDENVSDAPGAPVIISPTGGAEVATLTPTLTVANATHTRGNALTYTFCIVDLATDRCVEDVVSGETTTSVVFTVAGFALVEGQAYDWYAVANDGLADGIESELGSFVVDATNEAPGAPDALAPANDAEFVEGSSVSLEARAVIDADGDAVTYTFAVSTDATFATTVTTSAARAVPLFTIGSALPVGSYFWRATASDGTLSTTGSVGNFDVVAVETNVAPSAPAVVSPSNTTITSASATLTITAGSDADGDGLVYEFELADNAAFANATTSGAQAGLTFDVSDLAEDTAHFWRARAFDGALYSDWAAATFVVNAVNAAPAGLAILSPSDGSLLLAGPSAFTVQNAVDAEGDVLSYVFTVATDEAFANVVASGTVEEGTSTTTFTSTPATFTKGTTYFWRVEASDAGTEKATATASFSMFDDSEPADPVVSGGGCGCSTSSNGDVLGFALFGVVVALRRRRRA